VESGRVAASSHWLLLDRDALLTLTHTIIIITTLDGWLIGWLLCICPHRA